ncbi:MAG: histidine--tRNA ligase [Planctomycetota bacterium]|jgi:histidyl-tRNA synthetase
MAGKEVIRIPRGTVDLTGEELARIEAVEGTAREVFERFGYREIRGPLFEETRLFARTTGETTDIVEREMFSIPREGEPYSLRPEGTPSVVRHYVERSLFSQAPFQKLFYVGAMFRYERPQAGRQRQFHQVGVEALGSMDPLIDAEVILVQDRFFRGLGVTGQEVRLNTIGCAECRTSYRKVLLDELEPRKDALCANCLRRMDRNVLRVLDCKVEGCREVVRDLTPVEDMVCEGCREHYEGVQAAIGAAGVAFTKDPFLVRGLDYYTRTVFETIHPALGARDAICGGGRYDGLVEMLGGPPTPALGFAIGVEPTLLALSALEKTPEVAAFGLDAWVVAVNDDCRAPAFRLLGRLRDADLSADLDYEGRGMKAQMKKAARAGAANALILGPGEIERGSVTLRRMDTGEQEEVSEDEAVERVSQSR